MLMAHVYDGGAAFLLARLVFVVEVVVESVSQRVSESVRETVNQAISKLSI